MTRHQLQLSYRLAFPQSQLHTEKPREICSTASPHGTRQPFLRTCTSVSSWIFMLLYSSSSCTRSRFSCFSNSSTFLIRARTYSSYGQKENVIHQW